MLESKPALKIKNHLTAQALRPRAAQRPESAVPLENRGATGPNSCTTATGDYEHAAPSPMNNVFVVVLNFACEPRRRENIFKCLPGERVEN